jgi:hypothetical protein
VANHTIYFLIAVVIRIIFFPVISIYQFLMPFIERPSQWRDILIGVSGVMIIAFVAPRSITSPSVDVTPVPKMQANYRLKLLLRAR